MGPRRARDDIQRMEAEAEAAAREEERRVEEAKACAVREEARAACLLDTEGRYDEALARADELASRHPGSAVVAHLAAVLHHHAAKRAIDAKDKPLIDKHRDAARRHYIRARDLAPNCVEIAHRLASVRLLCDNDGEAQPDILRALAIASPTDPADNNVQYDIVPTVAETTANDRIENALKLAHKRCAHIVSYLRDRWIPQNVRSLLAFSDKEGTAKAIKPARELAERYYYSARAQLTHAHINLEFAFNLDPEVDNRPFLNRVLRELNSVAGRFHDSLLLAMVRVKILFVLGDYTAMSAEANRAIGMVDPADPGNEDVAPGSVPGENSQDRISYVRAEIGRLLKKLVSVAGDYWRCYLTREERDGFLCVGINSLHRHYVNVYQEDHEAANVISDALSFVKKSRSWRFWICPYCVGKKIPDIDSLLQHIRNKHPEGSVWPKLLSVLDLKLISDTFGGDDFSGNVTIFPDSEEQYVFHFKSITVSDITEPRLFSELRENKRTEGIEILEKIKLKLKNFPTDKSTEFNEACAEIRDLWHYFLEISVLDFRALILPRAVAFIWNQLLQCMSKDEKAANRSIDAAVIDSVFPYFDEVPDIDEIFSNVDGAPDSNAAEPAICPNVSDVPGNNASNTDEHTLNISGAPNSNAFDIDETITITPDDPDRSSAIESGSSVSHASCSDDTLTAGEDKERNATEPAISPNVGDVLDTNAANTDGLSLDVAEVSKSNASVTNETFPIIADDTDSNAAEPAICPNVGDVLDNNAAKTDALSLNVDDVPNSNSSDTDEAIPNIADDPDNNAAEPAISPNVGHVLDSNAANTDALSLNVVGVPDGNASDIDGTIPNIADSPNRNSAKCGSNLSDVNKSKYFKILASCSDDTLTDGKDKESEVHVKDENYGATVNEKESNSPIEMVEYGSELDATPENTASHLLGKFDKSTEEIASISCFRKNIDVLENNNADEDMYFLNLITQLLWNLRHFRNEFLQRRPTFDISHADPCIAEKLYEIFSAWEKNEHSRMVLLLTDVKTTLCEIVNESNMFQKLQVGRNFASEIMVIILEGLHKFDTTVYFGAERVVLNTPCKYRILTLGIFGVELKQLMSCGCGEWFGEEEYRFFHKLDASSLDTTKINSFGELSILMDSQSDCEMRCNQCSGSVEQIGCFLSKGPHYFTIVLKDWLGSDESQAILSEALFGIASPLDITLLYKGVTLPQKGGHSATKYRLVSVICYIEHGYVCFARDQDKWLKYDNMTVKTVDCLGELLELYWEINLQPEVLIYEVIK
uniref:Uncharacterized protein n=1 Tax=Leersia perrieri TaxID=77586 RepID=A0A0D9X5K5_9ORYZ